METVEEFEARVLARTGVAFGAMPVRHIPSSYAWAMGHIMARRGDMFVCAVGFPSRIDKHGVEYWTTFEVVVINEPYPTRPDRG